MSTEVIKNLIIDTPMVAVSTMSLFGIPLSNMIVVLTLVYMTLRVGFFLFDRYELFKKGRKDELAK